MIAEIIEKAYEKVISLAPDEYYQMLLSILEAYVLPQEGEIYFSVKDLENMPVGFGKEIEEIALAKGKKEYDKRESIKEKDDKRMMARFFKS